MNKGTKELIASMKAAAEKANTDAEHNDWGYDTDAFHDVATPENVLALIAALEQAQQQNGQLKAERDALRETGLNGQANTRAAADIYFQLIEECDIPPGGSLVQHVDGMRDRIAELEASKLSVKLPSEFIEMYGTKFYMHAHVVEAIQGAGGSVEGSD